MQENLLASGLVLVSAVLHAGANVFIKTSDDGLITRGCMNALACIMALPFLFLVSLPDADLWRLLGISVIIHALYPFFLVKAYRAGDLSAMYPIARGGVPILVTGFAAVTMQIQPGPNALAGIALISVAVASLAFVGNAAPLRKRLRASGWALTTSVIIAAYTVVDATGLRQAENFLVYLFWLFALDGFTVAMLVLLVRHSAVIPHLKQHWKPTLAAGAMGVAAYGLAMLALAIGSVAEIAALRESSIIFAALFGCYFLREPLGRTRIVAAILAVLGILVMHLPH